MLAIFPASIRRFLVLSLSLCAMTLAACGTSSSPGGTVEELLKAIADNRVADAESYFTAQHLPQANGPSEIEKQLREYLRQFLNQSYAQMQAKGGLESVEITKVQQDDPAAQVEAAVKFKNGETFIGNYSLHNDDGWKIVLVSNNIDNLPR